MGLVIAIHETLFFTVRLCVGAPAVRKPGTVDRRWGQIESFVDGWDT